MLESLFVPTLIVALAEIGDKTQLLALLLAARFRRPWPIIWGIVGATLANHFGPAINGHFEAPLGDIADLDMRMGMRRAHCAFFKPELHLHQFWRMDQDTTGIAGRQFDPFGCIGLGEKLLFSHAVTSRASRHRPG